MDLDILEIELQKISNIIGNSLSKHKLVPLRGLASNNLIFKATNQISIIQLSSFLEMHVEVQIQIAEYIVSGKGSTDLSSLTLYATERMQLHNRQSTEKYVEMLSLFFDRVILEIVDQKTYGYLVGKIKKQALQAYELLKEKKRLNRYVEIFEEGFELEDIREAKFYECNYTGEIASGQDAYIDYFTDAVKMQHFVVVPLVGFTIDEIKSKNLFGLFFRSFKTSYILCDREKVVGVYLTQ